MFAPSLVENTTAVAITAAVWLTLVTAVVMKGVKQASYVQIALTVIETIVVLAIVIAAIRQYWGTPAHLPSWEWISPFSFTPATFATGALTAIFFYWGWDVTMNLGEETKSGQDGKATPAGRGAFWAMINLMVFFMLMMVVVLIVLSDEEIAKANTNVLFAIAEKLFPAPWSYLAVLSTVLSSLGTIETQMLQFSRSLFSMSRSNMLPARYADLHPTWQTPWVATLVIWGLGMILLFGSSYMSSVSAVLNASVAAIGIQICFYMSLAGFACAWHYRNKFKGDIAGLITHVVWPFLAACFMVFIGIYSIPTFDTITLIVGIGGLTIGIIPWALGRLNRSGKEVSFSI